MIGTRNVTAIDQDGGTDKMCATVVHVTTDFHTVNKQKNIIYVSETINQVYIFHENTCNVT